MEKININMSNNNTVAHIILNDGKGNVLDAAMMAELQTLLDSFRNNKDLKVITIEGAGKHFSFGASVEEHTKENAAQMLSSFHKLFYTIADLATPVIAKISGQCLGGGMELAIMCNLMFADKTAKLGQPEIVLGVFPPPASILLQEKIGMARAEDLLLTGKSISADEAKTIGLLNEVFEDKASLDAAVEAYIEKHFLPKSASSLRFGVRAARAKFNHIFFKFLRELEMMYVNDLMNTNDANEGINSFLEKRIPEWKNC